MGEWGEEMRKWGQITGDGPRDVFQNIFAHDCGIVLAKQQ